MAEHDLYTDSADSAASAASAAGLLGALRAIVGAAHVLDDAASLRRYTSSTSAAGSHPLAVVRPASRTEVMAVVTLAGRYGVAMYPISTGNNWGYGDACAVGDGQLIVELARMNRILKVDPQLAYAVIEPGVTQGQLAHFLREHDTGLWCDCTGAGPDTSLIGNIVERGFGHSPYGNRALHIAGMQIVLASGELLRTGFGHYPQSRVTHLFGAGIGPSLDGLFTQSNLGVVVELGLWLMPAAACVSQFIATVERQQDLAALVEALRPLRLDGTLRSVVHIGNDLRVISGGATFPFAAAEEARHAAAAHGHPSCLPPAARAQLLASSGAQAWTASGCLYGSAAQVKVGRTAQSWQGTRCQGRAGPRAAGTGAGAAGRPLSGRGVLAPAWRSARAVSPARQSGA